MARFIATKGITSEISEVISAADKSVVLISPYVKIANYFQEKLLAASKRGVVIKVVCRPNDLAEDQKKFLLTVPNLELYFHKDVHSKCYYNERQMIIGSMNFYEYSDQNNREMGIVLDRITDTDLYNAGYRETIEILSMSQLFNKRVASSGTKSIRQQRKQERHFLEKLASVFLHEGFCIRCREKLQEMNPNYPLCPICYKRWAQWHNDEFAENYCHRCGEPHRTSMSKPLCLDCYKIT